MSTLVGARVRITIHDTDGQPHKLEGEVIALATGPGQPLGPGQEKPWECLVLIVDGDVGRTFPYNICDAEILLPGTPEDHEARSLAESDARIKQLDDEAARLTVELSSAHAENARLTDEIKKLSQQLQRRARSG